MRTLYSKGRGKEAHLTLHQRRYHLSSTVNFSFHLFLTALYRITLPARTLFIEQGIVIVIVAIVEVEALLCLHERCSVKGKIFLGSGGGGTSRLIFFTKRSSNGRLGVDRERGKEGDGRRYCTPFGKTACWRAGHALSRRAARARSLTTME